MGVYALARRPRVIVRSRRRPEQDTAPSTGWQIQLSPRALPGEEGGHRRNDRRPLELARNRHQFRGRQGPRGRCQDRRALLPAPGHLQRRRGATLQLPDRLALHRGVERHPHRGQRGRPRTAAARDELPRHPRRERQTALRRVPRDLLAHAGPMSSTVPSSSSSCPPAGRWFGRGSSTSCTRPAAGPPTAACSPSIPRSTCPPPCAPRRSNSACASRWQSRSSGPGARLAPTSTPGGPTRSTARAWRQTPSSSTAISSPATSRRSGAPRPAPA